MEYTSTLETLEGFLNALGWCCEHRVEAQTILYALVKVRGFWKSLIVVSEAPSSLSVIFEACHIDCLHKYFRGT